MAKLYPIGKHIKIRKHLKNQFWYCRYCDTDKIFEVCGYDINDKNVKIYLLTKYITWIDSRNIYHEDNAIHPDYVFSDDECLKLDRKSKLERLNDKE